MSEKETKANALPFEMERGFTAMPNAVSDFYVKHPRFTPTVERVYRYLLRRYNADYGYAWPSWTKIIDDCNVSKGTVKTALKALEHLELIKRFKIENDNGHDNNGYYFIKPIEDEREFYRKFGDELAEKYRREETKDMLKSASDLDELERWF